MEKIAKTFTSIFEDKKRELINSIQENMPKERIDINEWMYGETKVFVHKIVNQEDLWGEHNLLVEVSITKTGVRELVPFSHFKADTIGTLCSMIDRKIKYNE